jgi:Tfp pilus assembly protein PilF
MRVLPDKPGHRQAHQVKKRESRAPRAESAELRFSAEAAYAESIFRSSLGDMNAAVHALEQSIALDPTYAPAILSLGSVQYQRGDRTEGQRLFHSLLSLPNEAGELQEILDRAGDFLIEMGDYEHGLVLYRAAVQQFPASAALHQGLGCCAGHRGLYDEAVRASERALELEPTKQAFVNDLGWALFEAERLWEAETMLERAVSMNGSDERARENLRMCRERIRKADTQSATANIALKRMRRQRRVP